MIFDLINLFFNVLSSAAEQEDRTISVGGQAVIEGVLMRGPEYWGLAVREPGGNIWLKAWKESAWLKSKFWKLPILRGCVTMVEMMRIGMKALSLSADVSLGEDDSISTGETLISAAVAIVAVVGIFIVFPLYFSEFVANKFALSHFGKNVFEGILRAVVFIGYVFIIGLWKDMRRVFQYHGAEHKTINAYESNAVMTPESVSRYSRIHRRCGTSFLLVVVFISIIVFSFIGAQTLIGRIVCRVVLLPVVIGISYEFIKSASKSNSWGKVCIMPALSLQFITTRVPSLDQIEVAIAALDLSFHPEKDNSADWEKNKNNVD